MTAHILKGHDTEDDDRFYSLTYVSYTLLNQMRFATFSNITYTKYTRRRASLVFQKSHCILQRKQIMLVDVLHMFIT